MATPTGASKSDVSPVPSPNSRAKSQLPEPGFSQPASSELEVQSESLKPKSNLKSDPGSATPEPDTNAREPTPAPVEAVEAVLTKSILDREDIIDMEVLGQILELDEPDNHEFSMGMAWAYFEQAKATFTDMSGALDAEDLPSLSSLGHFLKGSSAALGITHVRESCERIQHYGNLRDEEANRDLSKEEALAKIKKTVAKVREEYKEAEQWLKKYYEVNAPNETPPDV